MGLKEGKKPGLLVGGRNSEMSWPLETGICIPTQPPLARGNEHVISLL